MGDELNQRWAPGEAVVQAYAQGAYIYHRPVEGVHKATDPRCWCGPEVAGKFIPCDQCDRPKTRTTDRDGCLWHSCDEHFTGKEDS